MPLTSYTSGSSSKRLTSSTGQRRDPRTQLASSVAAAKQAGVPQEYITKLENATKGGTDDPSWLERLLFPLQAVQKNLVADPLDAFTDGSKPWSERFGKGLLEVAQNVTPFPYLYDSARVLANTEGAKELTQKTPSQVIEKNLLGGKKLPGGFWGELGVDIATDPLTYVSFGTGKAAKSGVESVGKALGESAVKTGRISEHGLSAVTKGAERGAFEGVDKIDDFGKFIKTAKPRQLDQIQTVVKNDFIQRLGEHGLTPHGGLGVTPDEISRITAEAARGISKKEFKSLAAASRAGELDLKAIIRPQELERYGSKLTLGLNVPFGEKAVNAVKRTFLPSGKKPLAELVESGALTKGLRRSYGGTRAAYKGAEGLEYALGVSPDLAAKWSKTLHDIYAKPAEAIAKSQVAEHVLGGASNFSTTRIPARQEARIESLLRPTEEGLTEFKRGSKLVHEARLNATKTARFKVEALNVVHDQFGRIVKQFDNVLADLFPNSERAARNTQFMALLENPDFDRVLKATKPSRAFGKAEALRQADEALSSLKALPAGLQTKERSTLIDLVDRVRETLDEAQSFREKHGISNDYLDAYLPHVTTDQAKQLLTRQTLPGLKEDAGAIIGRAFNKQRKLTDGILNINDEFRNLARQRVATGDQELAQFFTQIGSGDVEAGINGFKFFSDEPFALMAAHSIASKRSVMMQQFYNHLEDMYREIGIKGGGPGWKQADISFSPFKEVNVDKAATEAKGLQALPTELATKEVPFLQGGSFKTTHLPPGVADTAERLLSIPKDPSTFFKWYKKALVTWKGMATALLPFGVGFHARNAMGNFFNMYMDGVRNPHLVKAWKIDRALANVSKKLSSIPPEELVKNPIDFKRMFSELLTESKLGKDDVALAQAAVDNGLIGINSLMGYIGDTPVSRATSSKVKSFEDLLNPTGKEALVNKIPTKAGRNVGRAVAHPIKSSFAVGSAVEDMSRMSVYINAVENGMDFESAAMHAKAVMVDYADLTAKEQKYMVNSGLAPFYCADSKTEVLSKRGWLRYEEVCVGDIILTLSAEGEAEWQRVDGLFKESFKGSMIHMENRSISALVTADHKWPVDNGYSDKLFLAKTEDLKGHWRIPTGRPLAGVSEPASIHDDDFVELVGWVVTEGHYKKAGHTIEISQSHYANPRKVERIRKLLDVLDARYHTFQAGVDRKITYFGVTGNYARKVRQLFPNKTLTAQFVSELTELQRERLYDALVAADGSRMYNNDTFTTNQKEQSDSFVMLCALMGSPTYTVLRKGLLSDKPFYVTTVKLSRNVKINDAKPRDQLYEGIVWCPHTANETFYARRNGRTYFTGNTWFRREASLMSTWVLTEPQMFHRYLQVHQTAWNNWEPDSEFIPGYYRNIGFPIPPQLLQAIPFLDKETQFLSIDSPIAALIDQTGALSEPNIKDKLTGLLGKNLGPVYSGPLSLLMGKQLFSGSPIGDRANEPSGILGKLPWVPGVQKGQDGNKFITTHDQYILEQLFPFLSKSRSLPGLAETPADQSRVKRNILSNLAIGTVPLTDATEQGEAFRRLEKLGQIEQDLKNQGYDITGAKVELAKDRSRKSKDPGPLFSTAKSRKSKSKRLVGFTT